MGRARMICPYVCDQNQATQTLMPKCGGKDQPLQLRETSPPQAAQDVSTLEILEP